MQKKRKANKKEGQIARRALKRTGEPRGREVGGTEMLVSGHKLEVCQVQLCDTGPREAVGGLGIGGWGNRTKQRWTEWKFKWYGCFFKS